MKKYSCTICCIVLIFILCFANPQDIPIDTPDVAGIDKVAHVLMYLGTCSVMWTEYLYAHRRINLLRTLFFAVVAPILMGVGIEVMQALLTETRGYDFYDACANCFGVLLALLIPYGWWLCHLKRKKTEASANAQN